MYLVLKAPREVIAVKREQFGSPVEGLAEAVRKAKNRAVNFASATRSMADLYDFAKDCLTYTGNIPPPDLCREMVRQAARFAEGHICGPVVELALQVLGKEGMLGATEAQDWFYQKVTVGSDQGEVQHVLCTREHLARISGTMAQTG